VDSALQRWRRQVNRSGHLMVLRNRRYFENNQEKAIRKEAMARKRRSIMRSKMRRLVSALLSLMGEHVCPLFSQSANPSPCGKVGLTKIIVLWQPEKSFSRFTTWSVVMYEGLDRASWSIGGLHYSPFFLYVCPFFSFFKTALACLMAAPLLFRHWR